jgi:hypothetical protein
MGEKGQSSVELTEDLVAVDGEGSTNDSYDAFRLEKGSFTMREILIIYFGYAFGSHAQNTSF